MRANEQVAQYSSIVTLWAHRGLDELVMVELKDRRGSSVDEGEDGAADGAAVRRVRVVRWGVAEEPGGRVKRAGRRWPLTPRWPSASQLPARLRVDRRRVWRGRQGRIEVPL